MHVHQSDEDEASPPSKIFLDQESSIIAKKKKKTIEDLIHRIS